MPPVSLSDIQKAFDAENPKVADFLGRKRSAKICFDCRADPAPGGEGLYATHEGDGQIKIWLGSVIGRVQQACTTEDLSDLVVGILAHEYWHIIHRRPTPEERANNPEVCKQCELDADRLSVTVLKGLEKNPNPIIKYLQQWRPESPLYPKQNERVSAVREAIGHTG